MLRSMFERTRQRYPATITITIIDWLHFAALSKGVCHEHEPQKVS